MIEPDGVRIARLGMHDVRALDDVEDGAIPANAVAGRGEAGVHAVAAHVPHLEEAILRVEEDAVAEDHRGRIGLGLGAIGVFVALFPRRLRPQHRTCGMELGAMECAGERGLLDQEIVDEQLTAEIDGNDRGRIGEVRRFDRLGCEVTIVRRPRRAEADAVVERFTARLREQPRVQERRGGGRQRGRLQEVPSREGSEAARRHRI